MSRLPHADRWRSAAQLRRRVYLPDGTTGTLTRWPASQGSRCTVVAHGRHLHPTTDQVRLACYRCDEDPVAPDALLPICRHCELALTATTTEHP